MKNTIKINSDF